MDILIDATYSPIITSGDFTTGDDLQQQQALLLSIRPGELKESPLSGVGLIDWVNEENPIGMIKEIKRQFKADGLKVNSIEYTDGEFNIDAERL